MAFANLVALHRHQANRLGARPALRYKQDGIYHDVSWRDYREQALAGAAALVEVGIEPGDRVGLVAENRLEWLLADLAIMTAGAINVPPHAPLTASQIHYQLHDADVRFLFVSTLAQANKVRQIRGQLPSLRGIVAFDAAAVGDGILSWQGFLQRGRLALERRGQELEKRESQLKLADLATVMYTSGTTGNPKGVMLSHGNLLSNAEALLATVVHQPDDVVLNWLPFSHIYARTCDHYKNLLSGVLICLAESPESVVNNLDEVQPTHLSAVPRFYEKVLAAVAHDDAEETGRRLRRVFGKRLDWMSSGGAPLPLAVAEAYQRAGLVLVQGYGLTETSPVISMNDKQHFKLASVGRALPGVEVRIAADGEVLTRGPHVMQGYWKDPVGTAEVLRKGWLHTGDLGSLDADGFLSITGRKKELLVLSNGKKVVPSFLEGLLMSDPCIEQAVVYGEGRKFLTALLVPQWDNIRHTLAAHGHHLAEEETARTFQPEVLQLLETHVKERLACVSRTEQVRRFIVLPRPFSIAEDEVTVSLKLKRNVVLRKHARELESLYASDPLVLE